MSVGGATYRSKSRNPQRVPAALIQELFHPQLLPLAAPAPEHHREPLVAGGARRTRGTVRSAVSRWGTALNAVTGLYVYSVMMGSPGPRRTVQTTAVQSQRRAETSAAGRVQLTSCWPGLGRRSPRIERPAASGFFLVLRWLTHRMGACRGPAAMALSSSAIDRGNRKPTFRLRIP
jgi:hypothetical protein